MALEIQGKVVHILDLVTGSSGKGPWQKRDFVIETEGQYPKKIAMQGWGDLADKIGTLQEGQIIKAGISPESREYQGRYYTDIRVFSLNVVSGEGNASAASSSNTSAEPVSSFTPDTNQVDDDLPF